MSVRILFCCFAVWLIGGLLPVMAGGMDELEQASRQPAGQPPQRIVALSWEAAENLLELGITPLAVADGEEYRQWVARPRLPAQVPSAGTRLEPNLELLASLKPQLIIISPALLSMRASLERIAPVLNIDAYQSGQDHALAAERILLRLGRMLGRERQAQQRLQQLEQGFAGLRRQLQARGAAAWPTIQVIRFANPSMVYVYGSNAMPVLALRRLGMRTTRQPAPSVWGISQQRVGQLVALHQDIVLYQQPFAAAPQLFASPLWQGLPFVRQQRFAAVAPAWSYGGVASLFYLAQGMTEALLQLPIAMAASRPSLH